MPTPEHYERATADIISLLVNQLIQVRAEWYASQETETSKEEPDARARASAPPP